MTKNKTPSKSNNILIVEDESAIARALEIALSRDGHAISIAPNGPAALQWIKEEVPDAIVLDLNLPDMNGLDVLEQMRKDYDHLQSVPVIIFTNYGADEYRDRAQDLGVAAYLMKDKATLHEVSQTLREHLPLQKSS